MGQPENNEYSTQWRQRPIYAKDKPSITECYANSMINGHDVNLSDQRCQVPFQRTAHILSEKHEQHK